ncbi:MAG: hypothetical protein PVJ39_09315 [Gammaproteobacteria bacterium]|jgi:hypothetical protein
MARGSKVYLQRPGRHLRLLVIAGVIAGVTGCAYDPVFYGPPAYDSYSVPYYDYYYYPSASVYFQFSSGYYYYRDHNHWVRTRVLPKRILIDPRARVRIRVDSDKPYIKYPEHRRLYKPKPRHRIDREQSTREREANRHWYQEHRKRSAKPGRNHKGGNKYQDDDGRRRRDRDDDRDRYQKRPLR